MLIARIRRSLLRPKRLADHRLPIAAQRSRDDGRLKNTRDESTARERLMKEPRDGNVACKDDMAARTLMWYGNSAMGRAMNAMLKWNVDRASTKCVTSMSNHPCRLPHVAAMRCHCRGYSVTGNASCMGAKPRTVLVEAVWGGILDKPPPCRAMKKHMRPHLAKTRRTASEEHFSFSRAALESVPRIGDLGRTQLLLPGSKGSVCTCAALKGRRRAPWAMAQKEGGRTAGGTRDQKAIDVVGNASRRRARR